MKKQELKKKLQKIIDELKPYEERSFERSPNKEMIIEILKEFIDGGQYIEISSSYDKFRKI